MKTSAIMYVLLHPSLTALRVCCRERAKRRTVYTGATIKFPTSFPLDIIVTPLIIHVFVLAGLGGNKYLPNLGQGAGGRTQLSPSSSIELYLAQA